MVYLQSPADSACVKVDLLLASNRITKDGRLRPSKWLHDNYCYPSTDGAANRATKRDYSRHLDLRKNCKVSGKPTCLGVNAFCRRFMRIIDKQIKTFMKGGYIVCSKRDSGR
jgi:hypothetical protein